MGKAARKTNQKTQTKRKDQVVLLYPTPGFVYTEFHECVLSAVEYDWVNKRRIAGRIRTKGSNVAKMRNGLARDFIEKSDAEWAIFIDTDMTFEPDAIDRLIDAAGNDKDIVGGLCFFRDVESGALMPTVYDDDPKSLTRIRLGYAPNAMQEAAGTGTAFLLIRRKVFEKLQELAPKARFPWFADVISDDYWYGEDIAFCLRARAAGFRVWVDTSVKIGHIKDFELSESVFINQQLQQARLAANIVIIPVKDRLDLTQPLVEELARQNETHEIVILDNGSTGEAKDWLLNQKLASVFDCKGKNLNEMWNLGADYANDKYQVTNLHFLNNDIKIGENFISGMAAGLRADPRLIAVCPNYDGRKGDPVQVVHGICAGRYDGTGGLAGFAFSVKGEFFKGKNGYRFPEELNWWYSDNDFALTIEKTNRALLGLVRDTTCEHIEGGSQTERPADWDELIEADRVWFNNKWGIKQSDRGTIRYLLIDASAGIISGGTRKLYDHVAILKAHGFNAEIIYIDDLARIVWHPDDIVVVPEIFGDELKNIAPPGIKRVAFVQNPYLISKHRVADAVNNHPYMSTTDLVAIFTESQHTEDTIARDFPELPVPTIRTHSSGNGRDGKEAGFFYGDWPRKKQVISFDYKHKTLNDVLFDGIELPSGWELVSMTGMSDAEVQEAMRTASIFVATNVEEGLCAPTQEAMISGAVIVCWTGQGPDEYLVGRSIIAEQDNIDDLRQKLIETANDIDARPDFWAAQTRRFSEWHQETYSRKAEIEEICGIFESLGY